MRLRRWAQRGLTLVELLVVVAIIGILTSVALPNFLRLQAKSRQSEAKINLKGIYKTKKSIFAEKMRYRTDFADFKFEGLNFYTYRTAGAIKASIVEGELLVRTQASNCQEAEHDPSPSDGGGFTVNAAGNIDLDSFIDGWYVNDANCMVNGGCCTACVNCLADLNDITR